MDSLKIAGTEPSVVLAQLRANLCTAKVSCSINERAINSAGLMSPFLHLVNALNLHMLHSDAFQTLPFHPSFHTFTYSVTCRELGNPSQKPENLSEENFPGEYIPKKFDTR